MVVVVPMVLFLLLSVSLFAAILLLQIGSVSDLYHLVVVVVFYSSVCLLLVSRFRFCCYSFVGDC